MLPGLFLGLLQGVLIPALATVHGDMEKKICVTGFGKLLCEVPAISTNQVVFSKLLEALVTMLEQPHPQGQTQVAF